MPAPAAARMASARQDRRSSSSAATRRAIETTVPSPTRIGGVTQPRLAAITKRSTMPSTVATPPAQASVRAVNTRPASAPQSTGSRGGGGGGGGVAGREGADGAAGRGGSAAAGGAGARRG